MRLKNVDPTEFSEMYNNSFEPKQKVNKEAVQNIIGEFVNYFRDYKERVNTDSGERIRSYYSGFKTEKFEKKSDFGASIPEKAKSWIDFKVQHSVLDDICKDCPAQYANETGTPTQKWEKVKTKLADLDTSRLHF